MKHRKLRISWSVVWGLAAALLIGLSVRSYWRADVIRYRGSAKARMAVTQNGVLYVGEWYNPTFPMGWSAESASVHDAVLSIKQQLGIAYFDERPRDVCIAFPLWFLILPLVVLAIAPWISWRFRIRTLLVITTALAGLLGLIASH